MRDNIPDSAKDLSDEQILRLRDNMEAMASLFFDMWLEEKRKNKKNLNPDLGN